MRYFVLVSDRSIVHETFCVTVFASTWEPQVKAAAKTRDARPVLRIVPALLAACALTRCAGCGARNTAVKENLVKKELSRGEPVVCLCWHMCCRDAASVSRSAARSRGNARAPGW